VKQGEKHDSCENLRQSNGSGRPAENVAGAGRILFVIYLHKQHCGSSGMAATRTFLADTGKTLGFSLKLEHWNDGMFDWQAAQKFSVMRVPIVPVSGPQNLLVG
jgi:hypothetical protein